jgi:predicted house-cleaning noncanonical NTP pyrophosphatase (MazG superfamily)
MSTKIWQIRCPDCGGIVAESEDSRENLGKEYTCDGPHNEDVTFTAQLIHISHRIKEEEGFIRYNKLVRDRIPEIIELDGHTCKYHVATDDELERLLHQKLLEEVQEFIAKPSAEEMADILEVVDGLRKLHKIDITELKHQKIMKRTNRGGFDKKYVLESTKKNVDVKATEKYRNH